MTTNRTLTATRPGPTALNVVLLGTAGSLTVRIDPECRRAELTVRTDDDTGSSAEAIEQGLLASDGKYLVAEVMRASGLGGIRHTALGWGTLVGGTISTPMTQDTSPIHIEAVLPPGSSIRTADTEAADIAITGTVTDVHAWSARGTIQISQATGQVRARTYTSAITIGTARSVHAESDSGPIEVSRTGEACIKTEDAPIRIADCGSSAHLRSFSGPITAHATGSGLIDASTFSGDITLTASQPALDADVKIRATTATARICVPDRFRFWRRPASNRQEAGHVAS